MQTLQVGGVPEHFNVPWHHAIESGAFAEAGVDVQWHDQKGGTGQMMTALGAGELDVAVALTEGIVTAISQGLDSKIVRYYTTSALQWGIHTRAGSGRASEADLTGTDRYAVSRLGSGSHLMAHVLADRLGLTIGDDNFVIVGDIDGARDALQLGEAEVFLWDRFMTSPLVSAGEFDRIGVQPTPWPAFAIAVRADRLEQERPGLEATLNTVADAAARFSARTTDDAAAEIAQRYALSIEQASEWFDATTFDTGEPIDATSIEGVQARLLELGVIDHRKPVGELLAPF